MFHKARPVDFPLCQELGMIVRFVKYQRSLQAEKLITFLFGHKDSCIQYYGGNFQVSEMPFSLREQLAVSPLAFSGLPVALTGFSHKQNCREIPAPGPPWGGPHLPNEFLPAYSCESEIAQVPATLPPYLQGGSLHKSLKSCCHCSLPRTQHSDLFHPPQCHPFDSGIQS